ncbi:hypothetical protein [Ferrovibrio terrae]|uniref:hypothetical protein n=1 Tax=Ferrovibrio terrae TaxID=2594003 RepID=UPI0031379DF7
MWMTLIPAAASLASAALSKGGGNDGGNFGGGGGGGLGGLSSMLPGLGGGGSTKVTTSVSQNTSITNNPVIANYIGDSGGIEANPWGSSNGSAPATATATDTRPNTGYLPSAWNGGYTAPYGDQTLIPRTGNALSPAGDDGGMLAVAAAAGLGLLLLFND